MSAAGAARDGGHLVGIQYLRGIAATMVAAHHTLEESYGAGETLGRAPDWLTTFGAAGVDIFFVISGLVMLHASFPAGGGADRPGPFLAKRFVRIFPLYWLCLAGLFACWAIGFYRTLDPEPLFMLRNAVLWPGERLALGVSWTLSYELYFYLLFALTLFARSRAVSLVAVAALLGAGLACAPLLPPGAAAHLVGNPIMLEFVLGLAIAYALPLVPAARWQPWLALPAFALLVASPLLLPHDSTNELPMPGRLLLWGVPGAAIVWSFARLRPAPEPLHRALKLIGDASYSIYLTHPFVMLIYARLLRQSAALRDMPQPPFVLAVVLACVALGLWVHWYAEKPLMQLLRGRRAGQRTPAPAARPALPRSPELQA
jgi:peptidoglycan/LPS O-acetylase OafA/YrhL